MRASEFVFVGSLVARVPELTPLLQEHLDDYEGLLPHVFMGDVTRWAIERFKVDETDRSLQNALDFMEGWAATSKEKDQELVVVSLLENLPFPGQDGEGIREVLGPTLRQLLAMI
jgi:hypothetical protein